tara:strand:- start:2480 stop:3808 length:1329 start_codon:yes stop_codon:yes gene_type:complete
MQAGDSVRMNLDQEVYPGFPEYISGVVQQPVLAVNTVDAENCVVPGTAYIIEYDDADLLGVVPLLSACDVLDLDCVTCCDVLNDRVDNLPGVVAGDGITVTEGADAANPFIVTKDYDGEVTLITTTDTLVPGTPLPPADLSGVPAGADKDGDVVYATYVNDFVARWHYASGALVKGQIVEWPAGSVIESAEVGFDRFTYTDKTGATTSWDIYPGIKSVIQTVTDADGVTTVTHDDGTGNQVSWFTVNKTKLLLTDGSITADAILGDTLEVTVDTGAGHVVKHIPILGTAVPAVGKQIGGIQSYATADQVIGTSEAAVALNTNSVQTGCLSRTGSVVTTTKACRLTGTLNLQVNQADIANVLTYWVKVNGSNVVGSGAIHDSGVVASSNQATLSVNLDLAIGDTVEFYGLSSIAAGASLDYTAAALGAPIVPSASIALTASSI